jgi:chaperonin GroES
MNISPLADRVVIEPIEEEADTSGIIIPDTAKEEGPQRGIVRRIGPGKFEAGVRIKPEVKVGDAVFFTHADSSLKIDGKEHLIVREENIEAKVDLKESK